MFEALQGMLGTGVRLVGFGELKHGENESVFKQTGEWGRMFDGIFLEIPVDFQSAVDHYLTCREFNKDFDSLLKGAAGEGKILRRTYSLILDLAISKRIPVICVDSSKTKNSEYAIKSEHNSSFLRSDSRDGDMHMNIISELDRRSGIWFFVGGAAHLDYKFTMYDGKPSLGSRLKEVLGSKLFTILLLKSAEHQGIRFYNAAELDKSVRIPIPGRLAESFDAVIIHP